MTAFRRPSFGDYKCGVNTGGRKTMTRKSLLGFGISAAVAATFVAVPSRASAYTVSNDYGGTCVNDGSACNVICDNGQLAGIMYWNGSVWSDGVRSDPSSKVVADAIVRAQGTACT